MTQPAASESHFCMMGASGGESYMLGQRASFSSAQFLFDMLVAAGKIKKTDTVEGEDLLAHTLRLLGDMAPYLSHSRAFYA